MSTAAASTCLSRFQEGQRECKDEPSCTFGLERKRRCPVDEVSRVVTFTTILIAKARAFGTRLISCVVAWKQFTTTYPSAWASDNSRQCNLPVDRLFSARTRAKLAGEPLPAVVEEVELYGVQTPQ